MTDPKGMLVIACLVSRAGVKQTACFSRPTFRLSAYPANLLEADSWKPLLVMRFWPLMWRVLVEASVDANAMYRGVEDRKLPPPAARAPTPTYGWDPVAFKLAKLNLASDGRLTPKGEMEEVTFALGSSLSSMTTALSPLRNCARSGALPRRAP